MRLYNCGANAAAIVSAISKQHLISSAGNGSVRRINLAMVLVRMSNTTGCTVLIGGSGGIGRAIVERLAAGGEPVYFTYHQQKQSAFELAETLAGRHARCAYEHCDLTDRGSICRCLDGAEELFGRIRSIVFASGPTIAQEYVSALTAAQLQQVLDADVMGFFNLVQLALPRLRTSPGASVVAVTTNAVRSYPAKDGLSSIPKSAVEAMCRAIAKEEGRHGIRANCVAPGFVEAGQGKLMMEQVATAAVWEAQKQRTALRRFCQASEIAEVVAFIASPLASYITGQTIVVDGGFGL